VALPAWVFVDLLPQWVNDVVVLYEIVAQIAATKSPLVPVVSLILRNARVFCHCDLAHEHWRGILGPELVQYRWTLQKSMLYAIVTSLLYFTFIASPGRAVPTLPPRRAAEDASLKSHEEASCSSCISSLQFPWSNCWLSKVV
jgi:hypothetical protein